MNEDWLVAFLLVPMTCHDVVDRETIVTDWPALINVPVAVEPKFTIVPERPADDWMLAATGLTLKRVEVVELTKARVLIWPIATGSASSQSEDVPPVDLRSVVPKLLMVTPVVLVVAMVAIFGAKRAPRVTANFLFAAWLWMIRRSLELYVAAALDVVVITVSC